MITTVSTLRHPCTLDPQTIHLITESLYPLTNTCLFPVLPLSPALGNQTVVKSFTLLYSIYKQDQSQPGSLVVKVTGYHMANYAVQMSPISLKKTLGALCICAQNFQRRIEKKGLWHGHPNWRVISHFLSSVSPWQAHVLYSKFKSKQTKNSICVLLTQHTVLQVHLCCKWQALTMADQFIVHMYNFFFLNQSVDRCKLFPYLATLSSTAVNMGAGSTNISSRYEFIFLWIYIY